MDNAGLQAVTRDARVAGLDHRVGLFGAPIDGDANLAC
jgi:hypothetical protein